MKTIAVLSAGSNIGDRLAYLASAVASFKDSGDRIIALSPVYSTPPWGGIKQENFANMVLIVEGARDGLSWLRRAADIEACAERRREVRWGPRTLDLDVVAVRDLDGTPEFSDTEELTLPHPRAAERGFVLIPWQAADPGAYLDFSNGLSSKVSDLIDDLAPSEREGITRLEVDLTNVGSSSRDSNNTMMFP